MLYLAFLLVITCSYPCLCVKNRLIPANEGDGGKDSVLQNGDDRIRNCDINGTHMYSKRVLRTISVYHNGSVDFNDGSLSIAVFLNQDLNLSTVDAHYIYDSEELNYDQNKTYIQNQTDCVIELLENATMREFNLTDLFVVSWINYNCTDCENQEEISFQLAIASNSTKTYALFLYDGSGECDTNVTTGFKRDDGGYKFPILKSGDVSSLWEESNVGIRGVYIYEINDEPRALHETPPPLKPPPAVERDIRIEPSGLLEVRRNGTWGSVCDDYWTDRDADVACKQLGHLGYGAEATCKGKFPPNKKVEYMMDDVHCNGDENSLFECAYIGKEEHNCRKRERAGVNCITKNDNIRFWKDTKGQKTGGVIQLYYQGEWKFVCDHMWTVNDAQVACRQLGRSCSNAQPCFDDEDTDENTTEYWMDYVNCDGDEEALFACSHMGLGVSHGTCNGETKAGVICN